MELQRINCLYTLWRKERIKIICFKLNFQMKFIIILIFESTFHTDKIIKLCESTSHAYKLSVILLKSYKTKILLFQIEHGKYLTLLT